MEMKLTLKRHLVMRIKEQLTERSVCVLRCNCREITLEIHLVMRIKDKSNCRDKVNARKTSGHAY